MSRTRGSPSGTTSGGFRVICNGMTNCSDPHPGAADRVRQAPRTPIGEPTRNALVSHDMAIAV